jgi:hypothetical protein
MALDPLGAMLLSPPSTQESGAMEHHRTTSSTDTTSRTGALSSSAAERAALSPREDGDARADTRHLQISVPLRPVPRVSTSDLGMLIPPPPPRPPHAAPARADLATATSPRAPGRTPPSRKAARDDDEEEEELLDVRASAADDSNSEFGDVHLHVHCSLPNLDALADLQKKDGRGGKRSAQEPVDEMLDHGVAPPAPKRVNSQRQRGQGSPGPIGLGNGQPCAICKQGNATPYHALTAHNITSSSLDALVHRGWRRYVV